MQRDAFGVCCLGGGIDWVTLINIGELDFLTGRVLDVRAPTDRGPVADIGLYYVQSE